MTDDTTGPSINTPAIDRYLELIPDYSESNEFGIPFCVQTSPVEQGQAWTPVNENTAIRKAKNGVASHSSFYVSTQVSKLDPQGMARNRKSAFYGLWMIILDDVGTKVDPPQLAPTAIIESSAGNYQYHYVFDQTITDLSFADRLVKTVYASGATDKGGNLTGKFVRLPAGIRNKTVDGTLDAFQVKLVAVNPDRLFTPQQLLDGLGLTLLPPKSPAAGVNIGGHLDPLAEWLTTKGDVYEETPDGWLRIKCPWSHEHSDPDDPTGTALKPLGVDGGEVPVTARVFKCHHGHCSGRKTHQAIAAWEAVGYRPLAQAQEVEYTLRAYCKIVTGSQVGALWRSDSRYPVLDFKDWKYHFEYDVPSHYKANGDLAYAPVHKLWTTHRQVVVAKAKKYVPDNQGILARVGSELYYNTYVPPQHPKVSGKPSIFLDHVSYLLPYGNEAETFLKWLAYKLQHPEKRSYGFIMVADGAGVEEETYGIGRSVLGDILQRVFQGNAKSIDFKEFSGSYTGWQAENQLLVIQEIKQEADNFKDSIARYEHIKQMIDPKPARDVLINPKYGKQYYDDLYHNILGFTNHKDALLLPISDRRLCVGTNNTRRESSEYYQRVHALVDNSIEIARIYWWLMALDVSDFDAAMPPLWPGKRHMIESAKHESEEIIDLIRSQIPGDLVSVDWFLRMVETAAAISGIEGKELGFLKRDAKRYLKRLPPLNLEDLRYGGRIRLPGSSKPVRVRIFRGAKKWKDQGRNLKVDSVREAAINELVKNEECKVDF